MARRVRRNQVISTGVFDGGVATADVVLDEAAPSIGAQIDRVELVVQVTGVGTGTYDLMIEELGTAVALTSKTSAADADAAANTVFTALIGNGVGVTKAGAGLHMQVTENGAVSTGTKIAYCIWWLN